MRQTPHRSTPVDDDHEQDNEQDCQNQGDHLTPRRTPVDSHGLVIGAKHALLIGNTALEKIADFGKEPDSRFVVQETSMAGVPPRPMLTATWRGIALFLRSLKHAAVVEDRSHR